MDPNELRRTMSSTGLSLYATLDIPKESEYTDIKKSYRKLALRYHPDKNPGDPTCEEKFKEIAKAHTILTDPTKRRIYDKHGSLGLYMVQQLGEDKIDVLMSPWFKGLFIFCGLITGCYFCCCCCCCFNCCCGKFRPAGDDDPTPYPDDLHEEETPLTAPGAGDPIISQPAASPFSDPWAHEAQPINTGATGGYGVQS